MNRNVGKQQSLLCVHGSQTGTLAPSSHTRAKKGGSCPGESRPTALQNRVQFAVQQCQRK